MGYCKAHNAETNLRCNQCDDFICPKCSVITPVGHKCKKCVQKLDTHLTKISVPQYIMGGAATLIVFAAGYALINIVNYGLILYILMGVAIGYAAGEVAYLASGRKLGRKVQYLYGIIWLLFILGLFVFDHNWFYNIGHSLAAALILIFGLIKLKL